MAKKSKKKEDEPNTVVAKCDTPNEVVAICDHPEEVVANCENPQENSLSQYHWVRHIPYGQELVALL